MVARHRLRSPSGILFDFDRPIRDAAMANRVQREARKIGLCACLVIFATVHCGGIAPAAAGKVLLPEQSAGVFIGVEKFSHDYSLTNVSFAADDAIDLAYALSIERGLLPPNRVLLLLAGEPTKEDSRTRLKELNEKKAVQRSAKQADIYSLVEQQSKLVGKDGILVVSIATHGFSDDTGHLLMAEDSIFKFRTGVTAEKLLKATQDGVGVKLLFVDACREDLLKPSQRGNVRGPDMRSAMRIERVGALAARSGYIVFSAASDGEFAKSGHGNGFFTGAVVAGLQCAQSKGIKTFLQMEPFVRNEVAKWSPSQHPELRTGGGSVDFALPPCDSVPPPPGKPVIASVPLEVLEKIDQAEALFAVGGLDNVEKSFRLYKEAFDELSPAVRATLNQGLVAKASKLEEDSQRAEGIQRYQEILVPLVAQSRVNLH